MKAVLFTLVALVVVVHSTPQWAFSEKKASNANTDRLNRYGAHPRYTGGARNGPSKFQGGNAFANRFPTIGKRVFPGGETAIDSLQGNDFQQWEDKKSFGDPQVLGAAEPSHFQSWLEKKSAEK